MTQPALANRSPASPQLLEIGGMTHQGLVRSRNEDAWGACAESGVLFVADGLGGHSAGDVASRLAGDCMLDVMAAARRGRRPLARRLFYDVVERAERRLDEYAARHTSQADLATTLTAAWVHGRRLRILHIGDSRAYLFRDGALCPLTDDHSVLWQRVEAGYMTREQARLHPLNSQLRRCIGGSRIGRAEPDRLELPVRAGDVVLLATDGLTDMVPEDLIETLCRRNADPSLLVAALVDAALDAGGRDNITIVACSIPHHERN
jgi:PPM family protein phosphatase